MTGDPFESPKLLLARAKENAAEFKGRIEAYGQSQPWEVFDDPDLKTGEHVVKARLIRPLPADVRPVFSDAVNNLRHALDQAVNSAALEIRGGKADCYFPFGIDAANFALIYKSKRYGPIPMELRPLLDGLKPYAGGDDLLYALNRISGPNKHQAILTAQPVATGMQNFTGVVSGNVGIGGGWDSAKNELELARLGPGAQLNVNFQVTMAITIGGGNPASGQPVLGFLDALSGKAEGIINAIEAETARIIRSRP